MTLSISFLLVVVISVFTIITSFQKQLNTRIRHYIRISSDEVDGEDEAASLTNGRRLGPKSSKSTFFDRVIDDFMGKRYGAGEAFYGKRKSDMTEEEYANTKEQLAKVGSSLYDEEFTTSNMKEDAILIAGSLEDIGQWVAFELAEKGFNLRIACVDKKEAVEIFGFPGVNVDIIELKGSATSERQYARAIDGVQAIVLCGNFRPAIDIPVPLPGLSLARGKLEMEMTLQLLDMATRARQAKVGGVLKVVAVSRYLPQPLLAELKSLRTTNRVTISGTALDIISGACDSPIFESFRAMHEKVETFIRNSGFEYVVVRPPPLIDEVRREAYYPLALVSDSETYFIGECFGSVLSSRLPASNDDGYDESDGQIGGTTFPRIGILDLAETISQALMQDIGRVSFMVTETSAPQVGPRVARKEYYSVLEDDEDDNADGLRQSYVLRPAEKYQRQIDEDAALDADWIQRFSSLKKDS